MGFHIDHPSHPPAASASTAMKAANLSTPRTFHILDEGVTAEVSRWSLHFGQQITAQKLFAVIQDCRISTAARRSTTSPRRLMDISESRSTRLASAEVRRSSH